MKLNIANPTTGLQKSIEIDDDRKLLPFFERRMGMEIPGDSLGDEFKGYLFKISGGNDKQGFPMMQGVLTNGRVRLLFSKGMKCYRPRRSGMKKRKSVRGCIVGPDLAVMHLVMTKKGENEIAGLTDGQVPRRLGPKRASKIRKFWNLNKDDDVRQFVVRRKIEGKNRYKAPKVQRLVTASRLQRKRQYVHALKVRHEKAKEIREKYKQLRESLLKKRKQEATVAATGTKKSAAKGTAARPGVKA